MNRRLEPGWAIRAACSVSLVLSLTSAATAERQLWTPLHVAKIRNVSSAKISPDGARVAYTLSVPRIPGKDENGPAWSELHVVDSAGNSRGYITGDVHIGSIGWTPDGRSITFLAKRGDDEHRCLYAIPVDGGEAKKIASADTSITGYSFSPDGLRVSYLAKEKEPKSVKKLKDKGFDAELYEENWRPVQVWIAKAGDLESDARMFDLPGSASELHWSPDGAHLAVALAPTSLIDDHYMNRKIKIVATETGSIMATADNPGKIASVRWSPDGKHLAITAGLDRNDPGQGSLAVVDLKGGTLRYLMPDYQGHAMTIEWKDNRTILFVGHERCDALLKRIDLDGSDLHTIVGPGGPILNSLSVSSDGKTAAFIASSPEHASEVYVMSHGQSKPRRLTDSNPWFADMQMAKQEIVTYQARDGLDIDGLLIHPLDEKPGKRYPMILTVHGGPEGHYSNGWLTRYSGPGQVGAANGYAVFYPNYRGSTGRGVKYSKMDQADYAGAEFNDLVDGVEHLVRLGLVDRNKVGVTGGSYGGFATAWCATALTEHFAAAVMFVGISDHISKAGTTDIPNEMYLVHSRRWPWDHWDWFRERSPLYYVKQARTPILILHGKNDPRVHPSQSMELYRYLKVLGQTPVRLVFYPGEGHGNRKAGGRYDYNLRMMRWMDHYLKGPGGHPPAPELDYDLDAADNGDEGEDSDA